VPVPGFRERLCRLVKAPRPERATNNGSRSVTADGQGRLMCSSRNCSMQEY
jgi:hypothetical protein